MQVTFHRTKEKKTRGSMKKICEFKVKKIEDGLRGCRVCNGTGYYYSHTDQAHEDGGPYSTQHTCWCNKKYKAVGK